MKIIGIKGFNMGMRTATDAFFDGLRELEHEVTEVIYDGKSEITVIGKEESLKKADIIWCPFEREMGIGLYLNNVLKTSKPIVGHYEWIPPWRINPEEGKNWGYEKEELQLIKNEAHKDYYENLIDIYNKMDIKTTPSMYCFNTVKKLKHIKEKNLKDDSIKKENQILTIARFSPNKKIRHIIKALGLLKDPPVLKIIGYGFLYDKIVKLAKDLNVKIEFLGDGKNGIKAKEIQKSLFLVTPCASLPLGEAALFKVPTIMYNFEPMIEKHKNMGKYVELDNIEKLAEAIQFWLDNPEEAKKEGINSYNRLINDESGICTSINGAKKMVKIFEEALKLKE